jgi:hypothetical protein
MARHRRRKCRHCGALYDPDPRNRYHQRYCSEPECRKASKARSQRKWLNGKGKGYFQGRVQVDRVRTWRQGQPGYRGEKRQEPDPALQDRSSAQSVPGKRIGPGLADVPLQDLLRRQTLLLTGLIARLSGKALQDDIASVITGCMAVGRRLLEQGIPNPEQLGGLGHECLTPAVPRAEC